MNKEELDKEFNNVLNLFKKLKESTKTLEQVLDRNPTIKCLYNQDIEHLENTLPGIYQEEVLLKMRSSIIFYCEFLRLTNRCWRITTLDVVEMEKDPEYLDKVKTAAIEYEEDEDSMIYRCEELLDKVEEKLKEIAGNRHQNL